MTCSECAISYPNLAVGPTEAKPTIFDLTWAFVVWGVSGGFLLALDFVYRLYWWWTRGGMPEIQITKLLVIISLVLTMFMQVAGLIAAWIVVTKFGKRPFWRTLGWGWHPRFKIHHAVGLALLMFGLTILFEKLLPHRETDLDKFLKLGMSVRVMVVALAVLTAPLIEEVVYRGVVYSCVEGMGGKRVAVIFVTALFAGVHVPQYWGSYAAITAILSLSLALTFLRAWTGKILPCVVTHLVYNGIQAILLLIATGKTPDQKQTHAALISFFQWFGLA